MSGCKICKKYFEYRTSQLPYDICPKFYKEHVTITEIQPTKEELIKQYREIIDVCFDEINDCYQRIEKNKELVIHFNGLLTGLYK